jgi:hypothetical protein
MKKATRFSQRRNQILLVAVAVVLAAATYAHLHQPFISPLTVVSPMPVYLPLVSKQHRAPDRRIGVAEHTPEQARLLGLAEADYIAGQWRLPLPGDMAVPGDTAVFLRPTERSHWSTWLLCSWSARNGWYDEDGCREWVRSNPSIIYIVGNELALHDGSIGDGYWVDARQYAQWYHAAWELIKGEDPTAVIAPYGPVGPGTAGLLLAVWNSYQEQFGTPLPADFYAVHHYCQPNDGPDWCWTQLVHWIDWLERHRGTHWAGPQDYRVTEWGLRAWERPVPIEASLALMGGMIPHLLDNDIGITQSAWWPSCNSGWPDECTSLIRGGQVTALGKKYLELALR